MLNSLELLEASRMASCRASHNKEPFYSSKATKTATDSVHVTELFKNVALIISDAIHNYSVV